jgi:ornithine decarboxylase
MSFVQWRCNAFPIDTLIWVSAKSYCRFALKKGLNKMASNRIHDFLIESRPQTPCLVVDRDIIRDNYHQLAHAMPDTNIYYAVKANPDLKILELLVELGSYFDAASIAEIDMVLKAGAKPEHVSYGNTIKKERDIASAYEKGVRLFAVDCIAEVEKNRASGT